MLEVQNIVEKGTAKRVGIELGDVIVSINTRPITSNILLSSYMEEFKDMDKIIRIYRPSTCMPIEFSFLDEKLGITTAEANLSIELREKINQLPSDLSKRRKGYPELSLAIPFVTTELFPGHEIEKSLGMVRGGTVRSKNFISDFFASAKDIVGGEVKGYTKLMADAREESILRMLEDADKLEADAIVGVKLASSTIGLEMSEMLAYGTAVKLKPR